MRGQSNSRVRGQSNSRVRGQSNSRVRGQRVTNKLFHCIYQNNNVNIVVFHNVRLVDNSTSFWVGSLNDAVVFERNQQKDGMIPVVHNFLSTEITHHMNQLRTHKITGNV